MGTRGLHIVCYRKRYYVRYNQYDSNYSGLGAIVVNSIPEDPDEYKQWLEKMRSDYAAIEAKLEKDVDEMEAGRRPRYSAFRSFLEAPRELPRLHGLDAAYFYVLNLDREVLSMNFGCMFRMNNIPRQNKQWRRMIARDNYKGHATMNLDECTEDQIAPLALPLREADDIVGFRSRTVTAKTNLDRPSVALHTLILATVFMSYYNEMFYLGLEWAPESLVLREFVFALVSIPANQASFMSFKKGCDPRNCVIANCQKPNMPKSCGWLDAEWVGAGRAPLAEFGSQAHRPGDPPGASPAASTYWLTANVVVSISLVIDGRAVTEAVAWGLAHGDADRFYVVVMSLFRVRMAEVVRRSAEDGKPFVRVSTSLPLSAVSASRCTSSHPRERPSSDYRSYWDIDFSLSRLSPHYLQKDYPGLIALSNFIDVALARLAASKMNRSLPPELYGQILDLADYETWQSCTQVSLELRACCLNRYRLDNRIVIASGPMQQSNENRHKTQMAFGAVNLETGERRFLVVRRNNYFVTEYNWMPIIGKDRKVLMVDVLFQFEAYENEEKYRSPTRYDRKTSRFDASKSDKITTKKGKDKDDVAA